MKIKSLVLASSVLMTSAAFATTPVNPGVGNQEISITNQLTVSGQPTPITVMPDGMISSKHEHAQDGDVTCTLNGGGENLCYNMDKLLNDGVSIPYGQTLDITLYPTSEKGTLFPPNMQWQYIYTTGQCGVESNPFNSNPSGSMDPSNISTNVNATTFLGGSAYCHWHA